MFIAIYILLMAAICSHSLPTSERALLKLSAKTHDKRIISNMLFDAYSKAYFLNSDANPNYIHNFDSLALQYIGDSYCVDHTVIKYYVRSFSVGSKEYPASQCYHNTNPRFSSIILPLPDFHESVHGSTDLLSAEIETRLERYLLELDEFELSFNDFDDLDYGLECDSGYNELMQVMYRETVLNVNLQLLVTVPEHCTFAALNPKYQTSFDGGSVSVQLPMRGDFYCQPGSTVSCKRSIANTRNSRVKLYE